MQMNSQYFGSVAQDMVQGKLPNKSIYEAIAQMPVQEADNLFFGADYLRGYYYGREIQLCAIYNAKSGRCSEDCCFCAQSGHYPTEIPIYPLQDAAVLRETGNQIAKSPINRYSVVTSGRGLSKPEVDHIAKAMAELDKERIDKCVSPGILPEEQMQELRKAGVTRYHHNLEAPPSHFPKVCTTHSFMDRVRTIQRAKQAGFSICAGGVFGIGESDEQVLEMAFTLKELDVDAVPLNFLTPVEGTPLGHYPRMSPMRCLKIISLMRYVLPDKDIIICGGRKESLKNLHPLVFHAGASGIMTGDYLTTSGCSMDEDLELLRELNFRVRNSYG